MDGGYKGADGGILIFVLKKVWESFGPRGMVLFLLLSLIGSPAQGEPFSPEGQGSYVVRKRKTGEILWRANRSVRNRGHETVIFETGKGRYNGAKEPVFWTIEVHVRRGDPGRFIHSTRVFTDSTGRELLRNVERHYDQGQRQVMIMVSEPGPERPRMYEWTVKHDLGVPETLSLLVRHHLNRNFVSFPLTLVTSEPASYRATAYYRGEEEVTVPAGTYRCSKVELKVHLGLWGWLGRVFLPKTYLWHNVEYPFNWVKYEGLEAGLGSPYVVMERETPV